MFDLCFIGLGNPGTRYDQTKHNIGKDWLAALSQELDLTFEPKKKFESSIASSHDGKILWVVPDNYVNNSGSTVKKIIKNNIIGSIEILPVEIVQPITGGKAPAAPPITMFCCVFLFNQTV